MKKLKNLYKKIESWCRKNGLLTAIAIGISILGLVIFITNIIILSCQGYALWIGKEISLSNSADFGSFIGGIVGTIFLISGSIFVYLTYQGQNEENKRLIQESKKRDKEEEKRDFESMFFQMIRLYKENISELHYENIEKIEKRDVLKKYIMRLLNVIMK